MTQHNVKQGIKEFGQERAEGVKLELKQLHNRTAVQPVEANGLT